MKRGLPFAGAFVAVLLAGPTTSRASDHVDGVKTAIDRGGDITDVYVFPSPQDANKVVFVMNTRSLATSMSRFSDAVDYKFRIRPIADPAKLTPSTDASKEEVITCTFGGGMPFIQAKQRAKCKLDLARGSETVEFETRGAQGIRAGGIAQKGDIKVFAGARSDTWFLDLGKTIKVNKGERVANSSGSNGLQGTNVLSIVVEFDKSRLGNSLIAVTGQTVRK
jgi:hypothetical protein